MQTLTSITINDISKENYSMITYLEFLFNNNNNDLGFVSKLIKNKEFWFSPEEDGQVVFKPLSINVDGLSNILNTFRQFENQPFEDGLKSGYELQSITDSIILKRVTHESTYYKNLEALSYLLSVVIEQYKKFMK
jgi:hypothetical protein